MNTPPPITDLDPQHIALALARHWHVRVGTMSYLPVGFGSHHWLASNQDSEEQSFFVTADLVEPDGKDRGLLRRALDTAWYLRHRAGIESVVAPIRTPAGEIIVPVAERWVVALYPHLDLAASAWGPFGTDQDRDRAQQLVARLHAVDTSGLAMDPPPTEDFDTPYRGDLFALLASIGDPWDTGPYGAPARERLEHHAAAIRAAFARYDALVEGARGSQERWVITHGEPHAGNIVWRADRQDMVMVDWDTCAIAPRERDLWQLFPAGSTALTGLQAYLDAAGIPATAVSVDRLALYRLRWDLAEIAIYAHQFAREHDDSADSRVAWGGFTSSLVLLSHHLGEGASLATLEGETGGFLP